MRENLNICHLLGCSDFQMLGVYMHEACSYDCETIGEEEVLQADTSLTLKKRIPMLVLSSISKDRNVKMSVSLFF